MTVPEANDLGMEKLIPAEIELGQPPGDIVIT
jgi:hypothetical protein